METLSPVQLAEEVIKIRKKCESDIPDFPNGKCNKAVAELTNQLGCTRVETIYTPKGGFPIGHVIALYEPLGIYIDLTRDQFSEESKQPVTMFWQSKPDSRYGVSYFKS